MTLPKEPSATACAAWTAYEREVFETSQPRAFDYIREKCERVTETREGFVAQSPLRHPERTPSFFVSRDRGWIDRGTQEGGHLYRFVRICHSLTSHREVIDRMAQIAGIPTWDERKGTSGSGASLSQEEAERLWAGEADREAAFSALTWLVILMATHIPDQAVDHLANHYGFSEAFIADERMGYCPPTLWSLATETYDGLDRHGRKALLSTGLFHVSRDGPVSPNLACRLVFPYWKGDICRYAIGREWFGRAARSDVLPSYWESKEGRYDRGKYKKLPVHDEGVWRHVSPYIQNDVLWGEDCLRGVLGRELIITEGVTDAAILKMLGFCVISPVTVAFNNKDVERVLALLRRYPPAKIVIVNDNDIVRDARTGTERHPGSDGAKKMAEALWTAGHKVCIGRLPKADGVDKVDVNSFVATLLRGTA